jgi:putative nucleotidyltransferase with HDIG domain
MTSEQARQVTDEIFELYENYGGAEYAGEKVSQLEHMVQAAQLAEEQGHDEEVILAAFLHDIGHISEAANGENEMDGFGIKDHEEIGAEFLRGKGFSKKNPMWKQKDTSRADTPPITPNCPTPAKRPSNTREDR